jgi:hypothetical protein
MARSDCKLQPNRKTTSMTSQNPTHSRTLTLFCKVVDNFGDIGICWRLARQLQHEHAIDVTLWVDDLHSFQRLCPDVLPDAASQLVAGVTVRHWRDQTGSVDVTEVSDIVIEFFGCDIPPGYLAAMALRVPRASWLNLEGLSAEEWVEGCHALPSPHGQLPLTKYFFFPGFTSKTGGLLCEATLDFQRRQFQNDPDQRRQFLSQLGLTPDEMSAFTVSLFCYPHAPVSALFDAWQAAAYAITCIVPEGVVPFIAQPMYDRLLWACDVNFVRGEDSFVRAQWAHKPFIWHIYPQDKNLHHVKLAAFLQRYAADTESLARLSRYWNDAPLPASSDVSAVSALWSQFHTDLPQLVQRCAEWKKEMAANGDLVSNLLQFTEALQTAARAVSDK